MKKLYNGAQLAKTVHQFQISVNKHTTTGDDKLSIPYRSKPVERAELKVTGKSM